MVSPLPHGVVLVVVLTNFNRIVPLIASFQDLNNLYLVMDYMPGGDFLGLLIRDNVLSENVTRWYIAEMILCIEEAHALRWIHRDVKPDNFLISTSGHLKISDFGLAFDGHWSHDQAYYNNHRYSLLTKLGINVDGDSIDRKEGRSVAAALKIIQSTARDRHERNSSNETTSESILNWRNRYGNRSLARSVVGTSQYMAPEVVRGELYDARCDWWSVAIILYEVISIVLVHFDLKTN
jgi:protein-serine/threonine kinase